MSDKPPTPAEWSAAHGEISWTDRAWAATTPDYRREILERLGDRKTTDIAPLPRAPSADFLEYLAQMREAIARVFGG